MRKLGVILSGSAIVISIAAFILSISESIRNAEFQRISVVPHLTVFFYHADYVGWDIVNDGLGPAKIKSFKIYSNDKEIDHPSWLTIGHGLNEDHLIWSYPAPGTWYEVGRKPIYKFAKGTKSADKLMSGLRYRIRFEVCYCSLYDDCWLFTQERYNNLPTC